MGARIMAITMKKLLILILMYATTFLAYVCISIPAPFLPRESELHGQSHAVTGAMLGFLPLVECVFTIIWGRLTLQIGVRNLVIGGMMFAGISTATFGFIQFIPHDSTTLYTVCGFAIRSLQGAGIAATVNSVITILVDTFPGNSTLTLSILACTGGIGMMSGPAIGSGMFLLGGFWLIFVGTGGLIIAVATLMIIVLPEYDSREDEEPEHNLPYKKILLNPRILVSLAVGFFSAGKWAGLDPILEPELRNSYGLPEEKSALVFLLLSGTYALASPIAGRTVGQPFCMDNLLVMVAGLLISTTAFLITGPCPLFSFEKRLWILMTCLSVMGLSNCMLYVPAMDVIFKTEKLNLSKDINRLAVRGFLSGLWRCGYSLGTFFGMTFSGAMYQATGWEWTMTSYAGLCVGFIAAILTVKFHELARQCLWCQSQSHRLEREGEAAETEKLLD